MQSEPWVSLEEIAQHLAVSQDTVHRWIRRRGLPAHQVGRIWRFKVSQVDEWVQAGSAGKDAEKE
jgi:excisionase family DNA binding protein